MNARTAALLALASALVGCPLPQALPDYPAGTVTPPRIVGGTATRDGESIIAVPAGCATAPSYALGAHIYYQNPVAVEARWFVDYRSDVADRNMYRSVSSVAPASGAQVLDQDAPVFTFRPYGYPPPQELGGGADPSAAGVVHVVELAVSNGFDSDVSLAQPNRTPALVPGSTSRFELQTYRWIFVSVPASAAVPCP